MKIRIYVRGWYERKAVGLPVFHPGYTKEISHEEDVPEPYADHVFEMLRSGQVLRDTGLEVIQIQDDT